MALTLKDNFKLSVNKPNFDRDIYATKADMKAVKGTRMPQMFIASCLEDGKVYLYNKSNEDDPDTGKWRVLTGASTASTGDGQTITIDTSVSETSENPVSSKAIWAAIQAVKNAGGDSVSVEANATAPEGTAAEVLKTVKIGDKYYSTSVMAEAEKTLLEGKITAETAARTLEDSKLEQKITAETAAREAFKATTESGLAALTAGLNQITAYENKSEDANAGVYSGAAKKGSDGNPDTGSISSIQAYKKDDTAGLAKVSAEIKADTKSPAVTIIARENEASAGLSVSSSDVTVYGALKNSKGKNFATVDDVAAAASSGNYATKDELNTVKTAFNNLVVYKNADDSNLAAEITTRAGKDAEGSEKAKGSEAVLQAYNDTDTEQYAKITAGMNPDTKKPFASLLASEAGRYAGIEADSSTVTVFGNLQSSGKKAYATVDDVAAEVAKIVANAPAAYDTLKEVSDWISTHENSAATMNTAIQAKADKSALSSYATTASLSSYATKTELQQYAKKTEIPSSSKPTGYSVSGSGDITIQNGSNKVAISSGSSNSLELSQSVGLYSAISNLQVVSQSGLSLRTNGYRGLSLPGSAGMASDYVVIGTIAQGTSATSCTPVYTGVIFVSYGTSSTNAKARCINGGTNASQIVSTGTMTISVGSQNSYYYKGLLIQF